MPRPISNTNSLARGRVRASMNKYNLFNLYKKPLIKHHGRSLYQQKWTAKQETRSYHGDHIAESRWKRIFEPNLKSVAQLDASLRSTNIDEHNNRGGNPITPISLQTYAILEKRLEFAIFRSMFASSIRQARQFILSGNVKVNGIVIRHPSYPLKSGDIFNVTPSKVLMALGKQKPGLEESLKIDNKQIIVWNKFVKNAKENPKEMWDLKQLKPRSLNSLINFDNSNEISKRNNKIEIEMKEEQKRASREEILYNILKIGNNKEINDLSIFNKLYGNNESVKCFEIYKRLYDNKHEILTSGLKSIENCHNQITKKSNEYKNESDFKFFSKIKQILNELNKSINESIRIKHHEKMLNNKSNSNDKFYNSKYAENLKFHAKLDLEKIREDETSGNGLINLPWQNGLFGRQDPSKPYFTPWEPKPFIGAFAILPSHIEISFPTCHAIYLRDPVARPGNSEVISPFDSHIHKRAYMYYVRKGM